MFKYLVALPVPAPFDDDIVSLMVRVAAVTELNPPCKLPPHVSFLKPLINIEERVLGNLVWSAVLSMRETRMTVSSFFNFGTHYFVLPVQVPLRAAALWIWMSKRIVLLPEYKYGPYDWDNTPHITVATNTTPVFEQSWPIVRRMEFEPITFPVTEVALYRKPVDGGNWELVKTFSIPS